MSYEGQISCNTAAAAAAAAAAKSLQSSPTLCDPIDGSPPGSTVSEILQPRTGEITDICLYLWIPSQDGSKHFYAEQRKLLR